MHCRFLSVAFAAALALTTAAELRAQLTPSGVPPFSLPDRVEPQPAPPPPAPPTDDHTSILRFDPIQNKLLPVPLGETKPGYLYNRYHEGLRRRVWSVAIAGGGFQYALGEGSVEPAAMLDIRATQQERQAAIARIAPTLAESIRQRGGAVFVRLNSAQGWELVPHRTIASVWDLETLERWEWHGSRRVAVLHTFGNSWLRVDGRYVPATGMFVSYGCAPL